MPEPDSTAVDLDLDGPWTFDQTFSPSSFIYSQPFLFSPTAVVSEQPYSPLWAFSDDNNDVFMTALAPVSGGGPTPLLLAATCHPDSVTGNPSENQERNLPRPVLRLTSLDYPDDTSAIKERMTQALRYIKKLTEQHVLAQIWAPVKNGSRYVLTTSGQPFVLDSSSAGLHQYRMVSLMYMFPMDDDTNGTLGLPGRVFRQKLPEWTPNVQYYSNKEYPQLNHALNYNIRGTLALPVFEQSGHSCIGVLEIVMNSQKINYAPEVDKVCKALEAVNFKSSDIWDHPNNSQICNEGRQNALAEILEILTIVCETHNLPIAQTWVPCRHRSVLASGDGLKKSCSSFDGSCMEQVCLSTTDVAVYVVDAHMWGFREASAEHHLQKGQGVAGKAFASQSSCFCENITQFCKTEYPLVHYARMFGLVGSFAICLRSTYTGEDDYILEFFLPLNVGDSVGQQTILGSLLTTMKQHFQSLRIASEEEICEMTSFEVFDALAGGGDIVEDASLNGVNLVGAEQRDNRVTRTNEACRVKTLQRVNRVTGDVLSFEDIKEHFGRKLEDAAESLNGKLKHISSFALVFFYSLCLGNLVPLSSLLVSMKLEK